MIGLAVLIAVVRMLPLGQVEGARAGPACQTILATADCPAGNTAVPQAFAPAATPYTVKLNQVYGSASGVTLLYDFYFPKPAPPGPRPLVVFMHGGVGAGGKSTVTNGFQGTILNALTGAGFAVAAINVRNPGVGGVPNATPSPYPFPDQIEDMKLSVRYFRANASLLGIDPNHIGGWGSSLGSWLTALNGTTDATDDAALGWTVNGYPNVSSRYQAVASFCGNEDLNLTLQQTQTPADILNAYSVLFRSYDSTVLTRYSATTYVKADSPPFLEVHGLSDTLAPYQNATEMATLLSNAGVPNKLELVQNAGHCINQSGPNPMSPSLAQIAADTMSFFQTYL